MIKLYHVKKYFPKYAITDSIKSEKIFNVIKNRIKTFSELDTEMAMFYNKLSFDFSPYEIA